MTVTVRPARPEEYDAIGDLLVDVYSSLRGSKVSDDYAAVLRDVAHRAAAADLLVAVDSDGTLLGSVTNVVSGGPYAELAGPDEAEFRMLVVDPRAQRRGVGRALVSHCLAAARAAGRARMVLSSGDWMTAGHALYASMGFRRAPARDWEPVPGVRLLAFELDLATRV